MSGLRIQRPGAGLPPLRLRQRARADLGLTHNLGGAPFDGVAAEAILGRLD